MPEPSPHDTSIPLKQLPGELLPREKLIAQGRAALSDEELIAIFLRTGIPGCNVLDLAARLKRSAGSLARLGQMETNDILSACKGIGPAKAATLAAVFELGHRAAREARAHSVITNAKSIYDYFVDELRFARQERMFVLLLTAKREVIRRVEIGRGTLTRVIAHPRDIYYEAIRSSAATIILVHNHPSGCPKPSSQDNQLTSNIAMVGDIMRIPLMDHVIIGAPGKDDTRPYYSYHEDGKLPIRPVEIPPLPDLPPPGTNYDGR